MKIVLLIFSFFALLGCEINEISDYKGDFNLSIMSFNLRYDEPADGENQWTKRKESCVKMITNIQPSIFGIQEGLYNQVSYLAENLHNYKYVGVGRDDGHSSGEFAAIFFDTNHFELLENNHFWLSETPETPSLGWDANNIRIVTWAKLKDILNNTVIYVFNTHFDHKGETAQQKSSELLNKKIQ